jgi:carbon-monoxide dehydrogenase medium subunit
MSSSRLKPFDYFEPATIEEAVDLLNTYGDTARVLAGGVDLIPRMRAGSLQAGCVVNIQRIPGLDYIETGPAGGLEFGAMASLHALETSAAVRTPYPALYDAIHQIASVQTKFMGTAVGNLCVATPASDVAPALAALEAELVVAGVAGERTIPVAGFYTDYQRTALTRGEMVTGVRLPSATAGSGAAFMNLVRTHADIAKVTVTAAVVLDGAVCREARIAVGAVAPTMFRARGAEDVLEGEELSDALVSKAAETAAREARPITDLRSSAEYRREMVRVLVGRTLHKAVDRARASSGEEVKP